MPPELTITDKGRASLISEKGWSVLEQIALGRTTKEIGLMFGFTDHWAQLQRSHLYRKTGYRSEVDLCRFAIRIGLIQACLMACLLLSGCAWPGIDKGSKPYPIAVPPATNAAAVKQKMLALPRTTLSPKTVSIPISTNLNIWPLDPRNPPFAIKSYRVYQGVQPGQYTNHYDVANTNQPALVPFVSGDYFLAATSIGTNLIESPPSPEVSVSIPFQQVQIKPGKPHR